MYQDYLNSLQYTLSQTEFRFGGEKLDASHGFEAIMRLFIQIRQEGSQAFFIGNGGSAAIADHMTADFLKNGNIRAVSLYGQGLTTCVGNDYGFEQIFAHPLKLIGKKGDLLTAISSSGNSLDIINGVQSARKAGMHVITFTGFNPDNPLIGLGDYNVYVPICHYGIVESIHNLLLQQIVDAIMEQS